MAEERKREGRRWLPPGGYWFQQHGGEEEQCSAAAWCSLPVVPFAGGVVEQRGAWWQKERGWAADQIGRAHV